MTVRDQIRELLELRPHTTLQISQAVGIPQGEVAGHLEHLARSLPHQGLVLEVEPASCIACELAFEGRKRMTKPSRCPRCRSERIKPPRFSVRPG
ncbi:transcriptional regulator [Paraliomyxa miuraensis]|uniref:transcriptional regulator n=1 Tax=Paraliomyxa miuraensis TaxID=376150 RepID=UPI00225AB82C|nr:transcriptional regulator [Paraliomyxa miuraensis]MCX4241463.1 transcriptional regulator [Paraliomyxa miuraensis]